MNTIKHLKLSSGNSTTLFSKSKSKQDPWNQSFTPSLVNDYQAFNTAPFDMLGNSIAEKKEIKKKRKKSN